MPRGSGHPDLSQRPRREAPGMLTGFAILERELGMAEYARIQAERRLRGKLPKEEAEALRREVRAMEERRDAAVRRLDELHEEDEERQATAAERAGGRALRLRSPREP